MSTINKLGNYKGIEVKIEKQLVTDEELAQQIDMFLAQNPTFEDKDGTVENGDMTTIDFEGFKDGKAFDGGKSEGYQLEIGSGSFIPGFEDQMIGMQKGETKELNVTFPENYQASDLAGADVVFNVTVHNIQNKKDAQLNDEFVAGLNIPEVDTVDGFKEAMKANLQSQYDQNYNANIENEVFNQLMADSVVETTEEEIQRALDLQLNHMSMQLAQQGMQLEQYLQMMGSTKEAVLEQLKPSAKQQAEFEAIIDEIVQLENLLTDDEEANKQIEMIAAQNNITVEQVLEQVAIEDLKRDFNRMKATQFIMENAKIND